MASKVKSVDLPTGVTLQYVEQGDPSGIHLLFLPGGCDSWRSYEEVLPALPGSIHAFGLTLRGHGDSSKPEEGYRYHDFATDILAFMDALDLEAVVLAGHSLGTFIAERFAIDHPSRIRGIVIEGAPFQVTANPVLREFGERLSKMEEPVDPAFVRELQSTVQPVPQAFIETMVLECMKFPAYVWRAVGKGVLEDDLSGELHKIEAPTLIVWGDQDGMCLRSEQDALLAAIPNSRLVVYEGASHGVHWEEPERFAADVASFVETAVE